MTKIKTHIFFSPVIFNEKTATKLRVEREGKFKMAPPP